jgi:hypothetical protein
MNRRPVIFLSLFLSVASAVEAADSIHCGSRIVTQGDDIAKLIAACGEPAYRDVWSAYPQPGDGVADAQEWYYNFGSNQLLRILRLRAGRIAAIMSDGYGYEQIPDAHCSGSDITMGLSKFRLLLTCGAPQTRRVLSIYAPYNGGYNGHSRAQNQFEAVFREEWAYDTDASRFMRVITLENGRVVYVRQTDRVSDE